MGIADLVTVEGKKPIRQHQIHKFVMQMAQVTDELVPTRRKSLNFLLAAGLQVGSQGNFESRIVSQVKVLSEKSGT